MLGVLKLSPEEKLQAECVTFLRVMCPDVLFWHTPNENKLLSTLSPLRRFFLQKKMHIMGVRPGVADLILCWPGHMVFLELKAGKNKPTPEQADFLKTVSRFGFSAGVCYNLNQMFQIMKLSQAPMRKGIYGNLVC